MQIAVLVDDYLPSRKSVARLIGDLASEFVRQGHSVFVLTGSESIEHQCEIEQDGALTVVRARTGSIKGASHLLRGLNELRLSSLYWRRMADHLKAIRPELIVYYSPSIFFGPLVLRLKKLWGAKCYLVQRDIFPDWALDAGLLSPGPVFRYLKYWARRSYEAADVIGLESPGSKAYFDRMVAPRVYRTEVLHNWASQEVGEPATPSYRERLGLQNKVVLFFGGNIGVAQDMDNLLRLAKRLQAVQEACFLFVGEGSEVDRIRRVVAEEKLANVRILPSVPQDEYLSMLREVDIGLLSLERKLQASNVPGKILSYMATGLPTLASVNPNSDLPALVEDAGAGFVCCNGDDDALAIQATKLIREPALRREMGEKARRLLRQTFSVETAARQIVRLNGDPALERQAAR